MILLARFASTRKLTAVCTPHHEMGKRRRGKGIPSTRYARRSSKQASSACAPNCAPWLWTNATLSLSGCPKTPGTLHRQQGEWLSGGSSSSSAKRPFFFLPPVDFSLSLSLSLLNSVRPHLGRFLTKRESACVRVKKERERERKNKTENEKRQSADSRLHKILFCFSLTAVVAPPRRGF